MSFIRNTDLFSIATSGVAASTRLLQTTGNNIANVNTEGYVRERTSLSTPQIGGVEVAYTERVINQFAVNQRRRDLTEVGEWRTYDEKANAIDNLLANEANSISTGLSDFFASVQTAADDPSSLSSRDVVLGEARQLLGQMSTMSDFLRAKEKEVNLEFTSAVNRANSLIEQIGELNKAITFVTSANLKEDPGSLLNERDNAINELAGLLSIEVRDGGNAGGSGLAVNLTTGESLVLEDGDFNILELGSDADLTFKEIQVGTNFTNKGNTSINVLENDLGGVLGGLFRYRDEILGPAQRDLGQLAVAIGDAINSQNRLGMDMDQQLGGDIIALPTFSGLPYTDTPGNLTVEGRFTPGKGAEITDADIKITVTAVNGADQPTEITIEYLEGNGEPKRDATGNPIVLTGITVGAGYNEIQGGIEIEFDPSDTFSVDNEFLLQPTKFAANNIEMATMRPEDLAFALPVRVEPDGENLGDAIVSFTKVTNTTLGTGNDRSAFDGNGGLHDVAGSPSATQGAPVQIVFVSETEFQVLDGENPANVITNVTGVTNYENLLEQAQNSGAAPAWPASFAALDDYPGYDFSLSGIPKPGDSFTIQYNTDGIDDNRNAVIMGGLQEGAFVQLSSESTNQARTFQEAYSSMVGRVGEQSANADITLRASEATLASSEKWFQSVSGVSLDEEAANLVRFQQSYAASAQILRAAQELFDTILAAAR
ncbi:flagellar hook-associated protein FlgK [Alteromonas sediminis]|uniref:Flagellar hook-associated protein 1 n=1 Tax=Alteromonas sediminis TaxID=2259342 RepID=A0A3N5Z7V1_9ALTE|nr:flagellar hook-associated protein FlgK [Alteromonas sediminis]RPJ64958.1 flagellar hook-associated protein FlgK [Alteromonas sediminis]